MTRCLRCGYDPRAARTPHTKLYPNGFWKSASIGRYEYNGVLEGMYVRVSVLRKQFPDREYKSEKSKDGFFIIRTK